MNLIGDFPIKYCTEVPGKKNTSFVYYGLS